MKKSCAVGGKACELDTEPAGKGFRFGRTKSSPRRDQKSLGTDMASSSEGAREDYTGAVGVEEREKGVQFAGDRRIGSGGQH